MGRNKLKSVSAEKLKNDRITGQLEGLMDQRQIIRMKFEMNPAASKSLFNELNELLRKKVSQIQPTPRGMRGDERQDFRIIFSKEAQVSIQFTSSASVSPQKIKGTLVDLSLGGACLALKSDDLILPGTLGALRLDFLAKPLKLKMTVLDSKMKAELC